MAVPNYGALREEHLKFWAWLGDVSNEEAAVPVALDMYEGYHGEGVFTAIDAELRHMALKELKTTMGTFKQAVARTSDVVRADFDVPL